MVRRPAALPSALPWPVFTRAEAIRAGASPDRLRRPDLLRLRRGLYARRGVDFREADIAAALCRDDETVVVVGLSAARILGIPIPLHLERWDHSTPIHLATSASRGRSGTTVIWHDLSLAPRDVRQHGYQLRGSEHSSTIMLTTRARTWRDLAGHLSRNDLIAAGDHLLRRPRPDFEDRKEAWCTRDELLAVSTGRYAATLREAVTHLRIGADSPKETQLRLAFVGAGLPEPRINVPLIGADGAERHSPDFQWPDFRLCAEYEGVTHNDPAQVKRDIRRARAVTEAGWTEVRLSKEDLGHECARAVRLIRDQLGARGWRPRNRIIAAQQGGLVQR